jgi:Fe-S-cluster containining protein
MNKEEIIKQFAKYCSKCDGKCCQRGVFTVFGWEAEKLAEKYNDFQTADVFDQRGGCKDIYMHGSCIFSTGRGCKLPMELRPTDCVSFPFYPKLQEKGGEVELESILIQEECPYCEEISKNKELVSYMHNFWSSIVKKATKQEITDWIGENGCWGEWYKNAIAVKLPS